MARAAHIQNNFTSGEVSPRIDIRTDLTRYKNGLRTLQNMTIMPHGGATSRCGTRYVAAVKDSTKDTRLLDFQFNTTQAYIIELGDLYMRFFRNNGQIRLTGQSITGITKANPAVVTYSGSDTYANGDRVVISGVVGMTEVNNREFIVANVNTGANTFQLSGINSTGYGTYVSGGTVEEIYEIASPYSSLDIFDVKKAQSADLMYMVHGKYAPRELTRTGHTAWSIAKTDFVDGPYLEIDDANITLSLSGTSGSVTVTASSPIFAATDTTGTGGTGDFDRHLRIQDRDAAVTITGITKANPAVVTYSGADNLTNGDTVYISGVVGMTQVNGKTFTIANVDLTANTFQLKDTDSTNYTTYSSGGTHQRVRNTWVWLKITGYTSSTVVTGVIQDGKFIGSTGPLSTWRLGAWSSTTGFPKTVKFYENRIIYGGSEFNPDTVWGSAQDDYPNFAPEDSDDAAFTYIVLAEQVNAIRWLSPQKTLRIGTSGAEFSMSGGSETAAITPTNVRVTRETSLGSNSVEPLLIENATLFWQRAGRKLREFVYSFEVDNFVAPDISLISEHITSPGIIEMAYQSEPDGIVWVIRSDGVLIGLTYLRGQDVVGWHRHILGGNETFVCSISVIPIETQDQTWLIVERFINGQYQQYVEYIGDTFVNKTVNEAVFVDASASFNGLTRAATLTPAATSGNGITVTAGSSVFTASDVGRVIRGNGGKATIVSQAGTTAVVNILLPFNDTSAIASGEWTLSTDEITGLWHLEGETVTVLADGGVHPLVTVTNGKIELNGQYTWIHIGFGYTQILESLDLESGSAIGTAQGSRSRITEIMVRIFESVGMKVGRDEDHITTVDFRKPSNQQNEGIPLFTGEKILRPKHGWKDGAQVMIRQEQPLPLTVLGFVAKMQVSDAS